METALLPAWRQPPQTREPDCIGLQPSGHGATQRKAHTVLLFLDGNSLLHGARLNGKARLVVPVPAASLDHESLSRFALKDKGHRRPLRPRVIVSVFLHVEVHMGTRREPRHSDEAQDLPALDRFANRGRDAVLLEVHVAPHGVVLVQHLHVVGHARILARGPPLVAVIANRRHPARATAPHLVEGLGFRVSGFGFSTQPERQQSTWLRAEG